MNKYLLIALAQIIQFALAIPAYSRESALINEARMDAKTPEAARALQIQGRILCTFKSDNTGQACDLLLIENGSERIYSVSASNSMRAELMRVLSAGAKSVKIEGLLAGANTIEAKAVQAL